MQPVISNRTASCCFRFPSRRGDEGRRKGADRAGFTMVELLIVISIIALLVSITFVVLGDSAEKARIDGTRSVIRQLDSLLQERLEALDSLNLRSQAQQFMFAYNYAGNMPPNPPFLRDIKLATIIVEKDRFRGALPQRLEDLWGLDGVPGGGDDSPLWTAWLRNYQTVANRRSGGPAPTLPMSTSVAAARPPLHRVDLENIELLVFALTRGGAFGAPTLTLEGIPAKNMRDTPLDWNGDGVISNDLYPTGDDLEGDGQANGNDIPEIYDEWDHPLRFYNWPTRLVRPAGPLTNINDPVFEATVRPMIPEMLTPIPSPLPYGLYSHPLNQDPDDQTGALSAAVLASPPTYFANPFNLYGRPNPAQPFSENYYHTLDTAYVPLIVSSGPDERLGLYEPTGNDPSTPAAIPVLTNFPRRLAQPLDVTMPDLLDELTDNISNRQR